MSLIRPVSRPKACTGKAKPDVCALSDGEAGDYCTVGLVIIVKLKLVQSYILII
jgi:hypothetical protein